MTRLITLSLAVDRLAMGKPWEGLGQYIIGTCPAEAADTDDWKSSAFMEM